jgi:restriction system protein
LGPRINQNGHKHYTGKSIRSRIQYDKLSDKKRASLSFSTLMNQSVIYFVGDSEFKTQLPANVINSRLGRYIKKFVNRIILPEEINRIVGTLDQHMSESSLTTRDHVRSLRERHSSTTVCPKCGSNLVERTAKKGLITRSKFLGCGNYPGCRFTKNA